MTRRAGAQAGRAARRRGAGGMGAGQAGAGALGAQGAQGARGAQATGGRRAGRHGVGSQGRAAGRAGARGWAHGARRARPAWAWPGRWMGAQAGPAGPVLVHCAPGSVLARFLDPVRLGIFLSHQMNTVHCKINFRKKNIY